MTEELKNKIITRAIHFIATNTKADSDRLGAAIIEELKQVKLFAIPVVSGSVLSDSEIEEYIWEEIELPLCETDRLLDTDNYKRYLEAVKWAKFGRDERTDR